MSILSRHIENPFEIFGFEEITNDHGRYKELYKKIRKNNSVCSCTVVIHSNGNYSVLTSFAGRDFEGCINECKYFEDQNINDFDEMFGIAREIMLSHSMNQIDITK